MPSLSLLHGLSSPVRTGFFPLLALIPFFVSLRGLICQPYYQLVGRS